MVANDQNGYRREGIQDGLHYGRHVVLEALELSDDDGNQPGQASVKLLGGFVRRDARRQQTQGILRREQPPYPVPDDDVSQQHEHQDRSDEPEAHYYGTRCEHILRHLRTARIYIIPVLRCSVRSTIPVISRRSSPMSNLRA